MRALWQHRQNCSHSVSHKAKRIRRFSDGGLQFLCGSALWCPFKGSHPFTLFCRQWRSFGGHFCSAAAICVLLCPTAFRLREAKPGGFQTGGFPTFFGKGPDCVANPFGTVPRRCC